MLDEFRRDLKLLYDDIAAFKSPCLDDFKIKWSIEKSVGDVYQNLCKKELKKETGSFYTPYEIVEFMVGKIIEDIDFKANPYIKILDPSCGGGYFLLHIFEKLKSMALDAGIGNADEHILKYNIFGYDIDEYAAMITTIELYDRTGYVSQNIKNEDFLLSNSGEFDIVIGNPPYMGHKVLTGEYRKKLYDLYKEVFSDKADMSYCFIKKSIDVLKDGGRLTFITSRYMLEALNGEGIRRYIINSGKINSVVDFYGIRLIKGAGVDNIIIDFLKNDKGETVEYFRLKENSKGQSQNTFHDILNKTSLYTKYITINKKSLDDMGWIFLNDIESKVLNKIQGVKLSSICESYQGIITGCDNAFVLSCDAARELKIEPELLKPWIKSRNIDKFNVTPSDEVLIYSDIISCTEKYKNAISYIEKYKSSLEKRRECMNGKRKWYELQWGRTRDIFEGDKIVFPYKSSSNRFAIDRGSYFSADVYILKIKDMFQYMTSYRYLSGILNSSIYEFYIKTMAKKLGDDMYEYYPNKIMNLNIPIYVKEIEDEVISGGRNKIYNIDMILCSMFGITLDEYSVIRSWCI